MGTVKIKLHTWEKGKNLDTKFKRGLATREAFVDYDMSSKKIVLKEGSKKWKPWDTSVSRTKDSCYINERKEMHSGLCFENKNDALAFMKKHESELNDFAKSNPLFTHWSVMNVIKRFEPTKKIVYGKDIKED